MFCHKCGNQLTEDSGFCSNCGEKLAVETTAQHSSDESTPKSTSSPPISSDPPNANLDKEIISFPTEKQTNRGAIIQCIVGIIIGSISLVIAYLAYDNSVDGYFLFIILGLLCFGVAIYGLFNLKHLVYRISCPHCNQLVFYPIKWKHPIGYGCASCKKRMLVNDGVITMVSPK